jgi:catechol 2,3-dioxygenase-like lactoylglutathione lyase family enzyme
VSRASHHVVCVTDHPDEILSFLQVVLGLGVSGQTEVSGPDATAVLGWPEENPGTAGTMLGSGTAGLVEILSVPSELRTVVPSGVAMIGFAVPDIQACVAACQAQRVPTSEIMRLTTGSSEVSAAVVRVGGLAFELVEFHDRLATVDAGHHGNGRRSP